MGKFLEIKLNWECSGNHKSFFQVGTKRMGQESGLSQLPEKLDIYYRGSRERFGSEGGGFTQIHTGSIWLQNGE